MAHAHDPDHGHPHHAHHAPPPGDWRYAVGIVLNLGFVGVEAVVGVISHSTALLADAGHNLSDVLGLVLAGGAAWLARRPPTARRTYGYGKATVLAAVLNGLLLIFISGGLAVEAIQRLGDPQPVRAGLVMITAAIGVAINGGTALLFMGHAHDVNARGAFLHMAADTAVSAGVIVAAFIISLTAAHWIDPAVTLVVVAIIVLGAWGVLKEATDLAMDAAPRGVDLDAVSAHIAAQPGVTAIHDLHVWGLSTTARALTVHVVRPDGADDDAFLHALCHDLDHRFGIEKVTVQIERRSDEGCVAS